VDRCLALLEGHFPEAIDRGPFGLGNGMAALERTALVLQKVHRVFGWLSWSMIRKSGDRFFENRA
jgi:hypothetical protein